mmetsp:Transcript_20183/g.26280  ORF Transcript_20183/g.26280 Transcript_20183/m.26280 type:complete len:113 (+) Transcript_20183:313-651(+)
MIENLVKLKKFLLCKNEFQEQLKMNEQRVKEFREKDKQEKDARNALWFEDPTPTLFEMNELRISGPNRHLSDLSDSTVIRPGMKPFTTCEHGISACASTFYNEQDANLDSVD